MVIHKVLEKLNKHDWHYHKARMQMHSEVGGFARHLKQNFWTLALSTFGLATALMWSDVVKTIIDEFYPERSTLLIKFYVAITVTFISITATYVFTKLTKKNGS